MRKLFWLLPLSFLLTACPFESNVPLEAGPVQPVDSSLIGYWYGIVKDGSDFFGVEALEINRDSDSIYSITRYGKAIKGDIIMPDTSYFTGYLSYLDQEPYMNIVSSVVTVETKKKKDPPTVTTRRIFRLANISVRNDTLVVKTVSEDFSPIKKTFRNPEELKQALAAARQSNRPLFDELFTISYRRMQKPQPLKGF